MTPIQKAIGKIEERIKELRNADAEFCKVRWDESKLPLERRVAREASNEVTAMRHELEEQLKFLTSLLPEEEGVIREAMMEGAKIGARFPYLDDKNHAALENGITQYITNLKK